MSSRRSNIAAVAALDGACLSDLDLSGVGGRRYYSYPEYRY